MNLIKIHKNLSNYVKNALKFVFIVYTIIIPSLFLKGLMLRLTKILVVTLLFVVILVLVACRLQSKSCNGRLYLSDYQVLGEVCKKPNRGVYVLQWAYSNFGAGMINHDSR